MNDTRAFYDFYTDGPKFHVDSIFGLQIWLTRPKNMIYAEWFWRQTICFSRWFAMYYDRNFALNSFSIFK